MLLLVVLGGGSDPWWEDWERVIGRGVNWDVHIMQITDSRKLYHAFLKHTGIHTGGEGDGEVPPSSPRLNQQKYQPVNQWQKLISDSFLQFYSFYNYMHFITFIKVPCKS